MDTKEVKPALPRSRRTHDAEFKARIIASSLQAGISISGVALANEINPNLLRRWIKEHRQRCLAEKSHGERVPEHESLSLIGVPIPESPDHGSAEIRLDVRRGATSIQIVWPMAKGHELAVLLKELLR